MLIDRACSAGAGLIFSFQAAEVNDMLLLFSLLRPLRFR